MKTLVVHPEDRTTDFLKPIYSDIKCDVIRRVQDKKKLADDIGNYDRIIMLGHGLPHGLMQLENGRPVFIIDEDFVPVLSDKKCIYVWCHADIFVKRYRLRGLYTGMIISEPMEANLFGMDVTEDLIENSNRVLSDAIRKHVLSDEFDRNEILKQYNPERLPNNPIVQFNWDKIYYN